MKSVAPDSPSLKCSECKNRYHTGKYSGVTKNALKAMPQGNLEEWVFNTCKVHSSRQLASSQEPPSTGEGHLAQQSPQGTNFERLIKQNETSLNSLSTQQDEILSRLGSLEKTIHGLQKKTSELEGEIAKRDAEIRKLKTAVDKAEQYSRRQNVEIHGITQQPNEDAMKVIKEIAVKLKLPELTDEAVEAVHRLRAKEGKTPPLLVRFTERKMRDIWIQKT
ncbi:unnamed protein product [Ixodes pacificus]